ncbi:MAG: DNA-processing protein DprA [Planctomycetota bacterium]
MDNKPRHSENIENWLRLINAGGVGPATFKKLTSFFGSVEAVLGASTSELAKVDDIGIKTAEKIARSCDSFDTQKELGLAEKLNVQLIHLEDNRYPVALKRIYDAPVILYVKGQIVRSDSLAVAIVGCRRCSVYGQEQASRFAHVLSAAGFTIVSGMARGIDSAAHRGALAAKGRTIAVQGCGLANIFPPENKKLFEMIAENGACISELPLTYEPLSENFPARNRIIAGLSLAVLVVEAAERSGALLTAQHAIDNDREVMAVPGKIDSPLSSGTNRLIKQGARLVDSVEDIMEALGCIGEQLKEHASKSCEKADKITGETQHNPLQLNLSEHEQKVYQSLTKEPVHVEDIIVASDLPAGRINAALISLRLKGLIRQLPGNMFMHN